jgi:hypothetical protein
MSGRRGDLDAEHVRRLDAAGILAPARADLDDRRTARRKHCQLADLGALQAFTEAAISAANTLSVVEAAWARHPRPPDRPGLPTLVVGAPRRPRLPRYRLPVARRSWCRV